MADRQTTDAESREWWRVKFLIERDGLNEAGLWVKRTHEIYADALKSTHGFASQHTYRAEFEASILVYERFLDGELP